jgi:hypothetical protein
LPQHLNVTQNGRTGLLNAGAICFSILAEIFGDFDREAANRVFVNFSARTNGGSGALQGGNRFSHLVHLL